MKAFVVATGLMLVSAAAAAQTAVIPFGDGVMIQPQGSPATLLLPAPDNGLPGAGMLLQPPGGRPGLLSSIGEGQLIAPPPEAPLNAAPMTVRPFSASSTVIQKPGEPPILCTRIGHAIACN